MVSSARLLPFISISLLLLADCFLFSGSYPAPCLGLIAMIYWTLYRPDLIQIYLIISLGIMVDVIQGYSVWVHTFTFLLINFLSTSQFTFFYRKPFYFIWVGVAMIVLIYYSIISSYRGLLLHSNLDLFSLMASFLLTVFCIPIVFRAMLYCHRQIHERV